MEIETKEKSSAIRKGLYITGSLVILFMIYYAVMSLFGSAEKIAAINNEFGYKETESIKNR